jgi:tetratricopeptide (TPR) repeat protein
MLYNCALQALNLQTTDLALAAITPLLAVPAPRAKDLLLAGNIHLRRQEFLEARNCYQQVLALEPGQPQASINLTVAEDGAVDLLFARGMDAFKNSDYEQALASFAEVLAIRPNERRALVFTEKCQTKISLVAEGFFEAAAQALSRQDLIAAMEAIRDGLELAPEAPRGTALQQQVLSQLDNLITTMLVSGDELLQRDDFAAAEALFSKILKLDPNNSAAQNGLHRATANRKQVADEAIIAGNQALDEGRLDDAREDFQHANSLIPDFPAAREGLLRIDALITTMVAQEMQWGRAARAAGRLVQARAHFSKALNLQDSEEARRELLAIDRARSDETLTLIKGARSARERTDYKMARNLYQRAVDSGAGDNIQQERAEMETAIRQLIDRQLKTATTSLEAGSPQTAIPVFRSILELAPENVAAMAGLKSSRARLKVDIDNDLNSGRQALKAGDLEAATVAYNRVLALDPYQSEARAEKERIDALQERGVRPGDEQRLYLLGIELYTRGRYTEAVNAWEQVLTIAPQHEKARMNIDKAHRKLQSIKEFQGG